MLESRKRKATSLSLYLSLARRIHGIGIYFTLLYNTLAGDHLQVQE
jgi:hypothetical protein